MESAMVDLLVGKIAAIIENELSLIGGVADELVELKLELISMKSFIADAEKMNGQTEVERAWVASVIDMCYPVEDIIDEFMYHRNKQNKDGKSPNFLRRLFHLPKDLWVRRKVAKKMQEINRKLKAIPERKQRYAGSEGTSSHKDHDDLRRAKNQSESLVFAKTDHSVGTEEDESLLEEWLITGERERTIISIVGMGGSGKSTLAAKVYNSPSVKRTFDCYAWITVSQNYETEDLLKSMIKEFYSSQKIGVPMDLSSLRYKELLQVLVDYLQLKRYIVVLDDVWDTKLWKDMKFSLPDDGCGSRVMITTRNKNIAASFFGVRSQIHCMKPLKLQEAWDLFCATAFINNKRTCPQELQGVALELVQKCEGLPLAILALGGALSSKRLQSEWADFNASLNHELSSNDDLEEVKNRILLFSFKDLPYQLKRCFLYCCIFPEDYPIKRKRLIRLWMAEGFVKEARSRTQELVGDDYLLELVHRNMLQVVEKNPSGRPKRCKLHDMMRELALSMSEHEKFCFVYDGQEKNEEKGCTSIRRLSIQKKLANDTKSLIGSSASVLRSLLVFVTDFMMPRSSVVSLPSGFRLLRVLDLEDSEIVKLPDELGRLFNLRYLNLQNTKVKELPESIGNLRNLQTLYIRDSEIKELPAGLARLENLRHLIMYRYNREQSSYEFCYVFGTPAPSDIYKLKNLQVLACVEAEPRLMRQLKNMTQLTRIGITKLRKEDEGNLCTAIRGMNLLRYLFVMVTDEDEYLGIDPLHLAPPWLKTLILVGKLEKVPSWFHSLQNLTALYLHWSRLNEDLLPHIQSLPNLGNITLLNAYAGDQLCFSAGFNKLKILSLYNLTQLKKIIIKKGVMSDLQQMNIGSCQKLENVPDGIEHLQHMEELRISLATTQLVESIRGEGSIDRPRVRHIPKINHFYVSEYGMAYESLSRFDIYKGLND